MSDASIAASIAAPGVMEGGGAYNRHARIPAGGGSLALPLLEEATRNIPLSGRADQPLVMADYGAAQGKNSLAPMRAAIRALRARVGPEWPIDVVHIDQPSSDFNTLFEVVDKDPESYVADAPNVFCAALERSFYEDVLPNEHVDIGWSSYAVVWLSRIPMLIRGHLIMHFSSGEVRAAFDRQAAEDWRTFLEVRARELRPGGRLVVVLPGLEDNGLTGLEDLFNHSDAALAQMVGEGVIAADERARIALASYPRGKPHLLEPFRSSGEFCGLTVEHCELMPLPDAAWGDYKRDGNKDVFAGRHAAFFRAIFAPSLASALKDPGKSQAFAEDLERRLKRRLAERPSPFHTFVQTIVVAKQNSAPAGTDRT